MTACCLLSSTAPANTLIRRRTQAAAVVQGGSELVVELGLRWSVWDQVLTRVPSTSCSYRPDWAQYDDSREASYAPAHRLYGRSAFWPVGPMIYHVTVERRLVLFGHLVRMDESADTRRILTAVPQSEWRRPVGRPYISWMATLKNDLARHNLTLEDAIELALNKLLWRLLAASGAAHWWCMPNNDDDVTTGCVRSVTAG